MTWWLIDLGAFRFANNRPAMVEVHKPGTQTSIFWSGDPAGANDRGPSASSGSSQQKLGLGSGSGLGTAGVWQYGDSWRRPLQGWQGWGSRLHSDAMHEIRLTPLLAIRTKIYEQLPTFLLLSESRCYRAVGEFRVFILKLGWQETINMERHQQSLAFRVSVDSGISST